MSAFPPRSKQNHARRKNAKYNSAPRLPFEAISTSRGHPPMNERHVAASQGLAREISEARRSNSRWTRRHRAETFAP